jgi:diketogulonate reductase-like aldo/keto reductase
MALPFPVASGLTSHVTLNDGTAMPLFGFGTSRNSEVCWDNATQDIVDHALHVGYRLIDTAQRYQ